MKKLSHLFIGILLSVVVFSCSDKPVEPDEPEDPSVPAISNLSRDILSPEPGQAVVISATIATPETAPLTSVVLKYKVNDGNPSNVTMSNGGSGNVYSGTIPAQSVDGATVDYTITAANKNGSAEEKSGSYIVSSIPIDYTQLALNEINGTSDIPYGKYIELYNNSTRAIPLHGVTIYYNNFDSEPEVTWIGADQVIQPKSFLLLMGASTSGDLTKGLSATKGIVVELFDPDGNSTDLFYIGEDKDRDNSYSRVPDGTGEWYLTYWSGTPGVANRKNSDDPSIPTSPAIFGFTRDVEVPAANDAVKISATVRTFPGTTLTSVVLKWTLDGVSQSNIATTNEGNLYSGTISAQAAGSLVEYTLSATNDEGETTVISSGYIVMPDGDIDYSGLKLNEVSGVGDDKDKFYELINTGDQFIPLAGCKIYYNANGSTGGDFPPTGNQGLTWTGNALQFVRAGELFCLIGRDAPGSFTTGLTPERILTITLTDPEGNVIDVCNRAEDMGDYAVGRDKSFSRIPDGTGDFYFTAPTPCATNGTSAAGLLLVPQEPVTIDPSDADYTKLRLNEVNGVSGQKWVEIYNTGTEDIPLAGVTINYSNNAGTSFTVQWQFVVSDVITANGFYSNSSELGSCSANNANVIITLKSPSGDVLDTYTKLLNINTGQGYDDLTNKSHARIPDGTGDWYYTADGVGTRNATNGASTAGLIKIGEENGETGVADYTGLVVNEVSGNNKFVEIYNSSANNISLHGVKLQRNDGPSKGGSEWTGGASDVIPAGAYRIFLFSSYSPADLANNPAYTGWTVGSGISSVQILKVALVDPSGDPISVFIRGDVPLPAWGNTSGVSQNSTDSYSRMSDGTWAYAAPTPGAANGAKTSEIENPGYLTAQPQETELPPDADYAGLVVNEVSGNNKYVEIYNSSAGNISLHGVKLQRNDGQSAGGSEWTGGESDVIPAGAYRLFLFNSYTPTELATNPAYTGWTVGSGISSGQVLKVALVAPSGTPISVFIRGDVPLPAWGNTSGVSQNLTDSYSRMSDGTWAYAAPTPGAANGAETSEIENPGYLTAQP